MRIEDLSIALRPRSGWEAVELGFALARRHARAIYPAWLLLSLPVLAVLTAICWPLDMLWLPPLVMWWLKPVFERVPLQVLSGAVFGQRPTLREVLRAQWALPMRSLPGWLTWRRFSPWRSLLMPVDQLEGVRGAHRGQRCRTLARRASGHASLVLLVLVNVEAILMLSVLGVVVVLAPVEFMGAAARAVWETMLMEPPRWAQALMGLLYWLAASVVAPFHVGAGFGLYLNRRTRIEAWDLELAFRRMAQRLQATGQRPVALLWPALAGPLLVAALWAAAPPDAHASRAAAVPEASAGARAEAVEAAVQGVPDAGEGMEGDWRGHSGDRVWPAQGGKAKPGSRDGFREVFGPAYVDGGDAFVEHAAATFERADLTPVQTRTTWMPRNPASRDQPRAGDDPVWLRRLGALFSLAFENLLWIIVAALLVWFAVVLWRRGAGSLPEGLVRRGGGSRHEPDEPTPARLPEDVPGAARRLWQAGEHRAALALLYAAGVARLVQASGEPLPAGSTEADCLRRARRLGGGFAAVFTRTVHAWQAVAYAERIPSGDQFERLLADWDAPAEPVGSPQS